MGPISRGLKNRFWVGVLAIMVVALAVFPDETFAQGTAGGVRGVVSDATGAIVPSVEVTIHNLSTGESRSTATTEAGIYVLGNVPIGEYRIEATTAGFKRFVRQPVNVSTASTTTVDIVLEVGDVTETLTVEASATPLVQTDTAETSTVMQKKMVYDLPLGLSGLNSDPLASGRRQIEMFVFLTPGVVGTQWAKHFLGSPIHTSQSIIDGVPHGLQESPGMTSRSAPPFEAVEEFKVSTSLYPTEWGRGLGITNYSIRSGTNEFHGNAFWFVRNDKFDARGFFNPRRTIVRQNEYGVTLGGPIKKNKTFFFGSFSDFDRRGGAETLGLLTIPTTAFRQGDFSALRTGSGNLIQIFDPTTTGPDGQGGVRRDAFVNNMIPQSLITPQARTLVGLMPAPDLPGIVQNWVNRSANPVNDTQYAGKVDHNISDTQRISGSFWIAGNTVDRISQWGLAPVDTGNQFEFDGGGIRVNWDWTATPTLYNHFGFGWSGLNKNDIQLIENPQNALGIPGLTEPCPCLPGMGLSPYLGMGTGRIGERTEDHALIFVDTVSWTRGRHQWKFGGEYWDQRFTRFEQRQLAGNLEFSSLSTSQPNAPNVGALGDPFASLLLGEVFTGIFRVNPVKGFWDTRYLAFFVEDKFQATPNLTLTLGLRYDLPWPLNESNNRISVVDLDLPNPAAANIPGALVFGNDLARPRLDKKEWGPRLALAYRLGDKTVLRTGFGVIYAQSNAMAAGQELRGNGLLAGYVGFSQPRSLDQGVTPGFNWSVGVPPPNIDLPNLDPGLFVGAVADYLSPDGGRAAYTANWNFTIQRQLPYDTVVDFAYVANKGTRLPSNLQGINQVPTQFLSLGSLLQRPFNSPEAMAAGITAPFPGFSGSVAQALRPYPQYTDIQMHVDPNGNHSYHSFQAKAQKRFSQGLAFLVSYNLSKNLSDTSGNSWSNIENRAIDTERRFLEKSLSNFDQTHNLITNWIYELPIGKNSTGAAAKFVKGWELSATIVYQSGVPLAIAGGPPLPIFGGGNRPSRVAGQERRTGVSGGNFDPNRDLYLNIGAFQQPAPFTFGDVSRYEPDLRSFSFWSENLGILKRTFIPSVSEQFNIEFRAEFFNLFNHTVFANPGNNINSPQAFGRVGGQANVPRNIQFGLKINF